MCRTSLVWPPRGCSSLQARGSPRRWTTTSSGTRRNCRSTSPMSIPSLIEAMMYNGSLYSLPDNFNAANVYYSKGAFQKHGVPGALPDVDQGRLRRRDAETDHPEREPTTESATSGRTVCGAGRCLGCSSTVRTSSLKRISRRRLVVVHLLRERPGGKGAAGRHEVGQGKANDLGEHRGGAVPRRPDAEGEGGTHPVRR